MPHAKFQNPSINIDRDFQLSFGGTQGGRDTGTQGHREVVSEGT